MLNEDKDKEIKNDKKLEQLISRRGSGCGRLAYEYKNQNEKNYVLYLKILLTRINKTAIVLGQTTRERTKNRERK